MKALLLVLVPAGLVAQAPDSLRFSETLRSSVQHVTYAGRPAVKLVPVTGDSMLNDEMMALVANSDFQDGTIEIDVAGAPLPGASAGSRGFIGIAFRVAPHADRAEVMYIRPTNGRADDQLRRNHSTQYISDPGFPWYKLRQDSPGQYESYVDLEPGVWTRLRVVVSGTTARLFVNDAAQPCLVVTDLKQGVRRGQIALWANIETEAYFGALRVTRP